MLPDLKPGVNGQSRTYADRGRRGVALVSVAESLDTGSSAGRLVLNVMAAVSQWEREAIGERTRDAMRHKRSPWQEGKPVVRCDQALAQLGDYLEGEAAPEVRREQCLFQLLALA